MIFLILYKKAASIFSTEPFLFFGKSLSTNIVGYKYILEGKNFILEWKFIKYLEEQILNFI